MTTQGCVLEHTHLLSLLTWILKVPQKCVRCRVFWTSQPLHLKTIRGRETQSPHLIPRWFSKNMWDVAQLSWTSYALPQKTPQKYVQCYTRFFDLLTSTSEDSFKTCLVLHKFLRLTSISKDFPKMCTVLHIFLGPLHLCFIRLPKNVWYRTCFWTSSPEIP